MCCSKILRKHVRHHKTKKTYAHTLNNRPLPHCKRHLGHACDIAEKTHEGAKKKTLYRLSPVRLRNNCVWYQKPWMNPMPCGEGRGGPTYFSAPPHYLRHCVYYTSRASGRVRPRRLFPAKRRRCYDDMFFYHSLTVWRARVTVKVCFLGPPCARWVWRPLPAKPCGVWHYIVTFSESSLSALSFTFRDFWL